MRDFENSTHYDEEAVVNDFVKKDNKHLVDAVEERKDEDEDDENANTKKKRKKGNDDLEDSEKESGEGSGEELEDDGLEIGEGVHIESIKQRPKITRAIIEEIKSLQTRDLFEDIIDIKGETKLSNLQGNRQNLIELKDYLRDMYKKSFAKQRGQTKSTSRKNKSEGASAAGEDD